MSGPEYTRRQFIKKTAIGIGGTTLLFSCRGPQSRWRFFTDDEAKLVEAITEQIIPTDQDPGAKEASVVNFIDKQLVGPYRKFQKNYRDGLASVQKTSKQIFGNAFELLKWDQQTNVLKTVESGKTNGKLWPTQSSVSFFKMIRSHTMQGFYGSPRHGGNRNYASYKMLGLDYPRIFGRNKYKNLKA